MESYSQKDPAYGEMKLGKSKLTVHGFGCFVCSLATLFQRHPTAVLRVPGGITDQGLVVSATIAKNFGGTALPATLKAPSGWCIAETGFYADRGYPQHFFCVNKELNLQIDPLDLPAGPEQLSYPIKNYRPFTGVALDPMFPWTDLAKKYSRLQLRNLARLLS